MFRAEAEFDFEDTVFQKSESVFQIPSFGNCHGNALCRRFFELYSAGDPQRLVFATYLASEFLNSAVISMANTLSMTIMHPKCKRAASQFYRSNLNMAFLPTRSHVRMIVAIVFFALVLAYVTVVILINTTSWARVGSIERRPEAAGVFFPPRMAAAIRSRYTPGQSCTGV